MDLSKHVGNQIEIIYQDRLGKFSRRRIRVLAVETDTVKAFDLDKHSPRVFRVEKILAVQRVRTA